VGRQLAIAVALLAALGVLVAAMTWSTSARGEEPAKTEDVLRVERALTELAPAKRGAAGEVAANKRTAARRHWGSRYDAVLTAARDRPIEVGGNEGYATFFAFGHSLRG
jgi:hypothetical protein